MEVLTLPSRKTSKLLHAIVATPDLTTFCFDELGLIAVGQRLEPDRAAIEWRVVEPAGGVIAAARRASPEARSLVISRMCSAAERSRAESRPHDGLQTGVLREVAARLIAVGARPTTSPTTPTAHRRTLTRRQVVNSTAVVIARSVALPVE
jgi:hypothetical protein